MNEIVFKGFSGNEILMMFRFISLYDQYVNYHTKKSLLDEYPNMADWNEIINKNCYQSHSTISKLNDQMPFQDDLIHIVNNQGCLLLSFLYHFRNAIAHGQVEKEGEVIRLFDKPKHNSQLFTATGQISSDVFFRFIQLTIN